MPNHALTPVRQTGFGKFCDEGIRLRPQGRSQHPARPLAGNLG
jgi:hypothetical protein